MAKKQKHYLYVEAYDAKLLRQAARVLKVLKLRPDVGKVVGTPIMFHGA